MGYGLCSISFVVFIGLFLAGFFRRFPGFRTGRVFGALVIITFFIIACSIGVVGAIISCFMSVLVIGVSSVEIAVVAAAVVAVGLAVVVAGLVQIGC